MHTCTSIHRRPDTRARMHTFENSRIIILQYGRDGPVAEATRIPVTVSRHFPFLHRYVFLQPRMSFLHNHIRVSTSFFLLFATTDCPSSSPTHRNSRKAVVDRQLSSRSAQIPPSVRTGRALREDDGEDGQQRENEKLRSAGVGAKIFGQRSLLHEETRASAMTDEQGGHSLAMVVGAAVLGPLAFSISSQNDRTLHGGCSTVQQAFSFITDPRSKCLFSSESGPENFIHYDNSRLIQLVGEPVPCSAHA